MFAANCYFRGGGGVFQGHSTIKEKKSSGLNNRILGLALYRSWKTCNQTWPQKLIIAKSNLSECIISEIKC